MTPSPWVWMPTGSGLVGDRRLELAADVDAVGDVPVVLSDPGAAVCPEALMVDSRWLRLVTTAAVPSTITATIAP